MSSKLITSPRHHKSTASQAYSIASLQHHSSIRGPMITGVRTAHTVFWMKDLVEWALEPHHNYDRTPDTCLLIADIQQVESIASLQHYPKTNENRYHYGAYSFLDRDVVESSIGTTPKLRQDSRHSAIDHHRYPQSPRVLISSSLNTPSPLWNWSVAIKMTFPEVEISKEAEGVQRLTHFGRKQIPM